MLSTIRHTRHFGGLSVARVVQTWLMALVILLTGVTQSGVIPALLSGQATGIAGAQAAIAGPGSNVLLICTPDGIKRVAADGSLVGDDTFPADHSNQMAGHGFCSLCATHHGAMVSVDFPYVAPTAISHDILYAPANGVGRGHDWPRIRHSRAPPAFV